MFSSDFITAAESLLQGARAKRLRLATAESCTGGLIAGLLTEVAGSSDVFDRGLVTYSNAAKAELLGVPQNLIVEHGAVSEPVARAMAEGALNASHAHVTIAVTGVAGPGGGTVEKPVGLVHMASCVSADLRTADARLVNAKRVYGDLGRTAVRLQTVGDAVAMLHAAIEAIETPNT